MGLRGSFTHSELAVAAAAVGKVSNLPPGESRANGDSRDFLSILATESRGAS